MAVRVFQQFITGASQVTLHHRQAPFFAGPKK
jgi:hypothetical protein